MEYVQRNTIKKPTCKITWGVYTSWESHFSVYVVWQLGGEQILLNTKGTANKSRHSNSLAVSQTKTQGAKKTNTKYCRKTNELKWTYNNCEQNKLKLCVRICTQPEGKKWNLLNAIETKIRIIYVYPLHVLYPQEWLSGLSSLMDNYWCFLQALPCICNVCLKRFKAKKYLQDHLRGVHKIGSPYQCKCGFTSYWRNQYISYRKMCEKENCESNWWLFHKSI